MTAPSRSAASARAGPRWRGALVEERREAGRFRLDLVEVVAARLEQRLDLVERGQRPAGLLGLVEVGGERLADVGQRPALVA